MLDAPVLDQVKAAASVGTSHKPTSTWKPIRIGSARYPPSGRPTYKLSSRGDPMQLKKREARRILDKLKMETRTTHAE